MSGSVAAEKGSGVVLLTGKHGARTVRVTGENGGETLLHSLYDPAREATAFVPGRVDVDTVVFLGAGLGYHIPLTLAAHPRVTRIVVVERYPELAGLVAATVTDPRIRVDIVTPIAGTAERPAIPADLRAREVAVVPHPPSLHANPAWYDHYQVAVATAGREEERNRSSREGGGALTILVPFEAYYTQRECINGFRSLGHRVVTLDYRGREGELFSLVREAVLDEEPDVVFSVNMRGLDRRGAIAEMLARLGIPLALWFVDSPEFILYGEALPPRDACQIFLWDRSYIPAVRSLGYQVSYLPLAADTTLGRAAVADERFRAGISFVGNSLMSGFLARLAVKFPVNPETIAFAERAFPRLIAGRGRQMELLDGMLAERGIAPASDDERLFFRAYLLHGATSAYRTLLLDRLLPLGLTFFGDPGGWTKVFGPVIRAFPDVNYFHETPAVYASSAVNFNATSLQMPHTVNQRVFDVPLCGGFLLTDRQEALFELFAEDEVATYEGEGDVAEKAAWYLAHPAVREGIAARARARVLAEHTYASRMAGLLGAMGLTKTASPGRAP